MFKNSSKTIIVILIVTNFISAGLFISVTIKPQIQKKPGEDVIRDVKSVYSYKDNIKYIEKMSLYSVYGKKAQIVMLGNSITARVDWSELLNRNDILNRGIDADITEGFLSRMETIYSVNPKVCFIMGGINDIAKHIPSEQTIENIEQIVEGLKQHNIIPVLQSILYVTDTYPDNIQMNLKIGTLNSELEKVAQESNIKFLNLNNLLSSDNKLIKEFALSDGIHLTGLGYKKWAAILLENLTGSGL